MLRTHDLHAGDRLLVEVFAPLLIPVLLKRQNVVAFTRSDRSNDAASCAGGQYPLDGGDEGCPLLMVP